VAVSNQTLRLAQRLRTDLAKITDARTRDLTAAWVRAWDTVAGDLEAAVQELLANAQGGMLSRAAILRSRRLAIALDAIARQLTQLTDDAGIQITADLTTVVQQASAAQEAIIASQLPKAAAALITADVPVQALSAIVQRSTETVTSSLWPISSEADAAIRRGLVRGLANGSNPNKVARDIIRGTEGHFNGGLSRALTIARTEILDAYRDAAKESHQANADVLDGWIWLTKLDALTCPACLGMAGSEHPLDESGPDGHQNCRCARMPKTKTWAELGIDLDEPAPATPDAEAWFSALDEATQRQILGPARYAAWAAGNYPLSKWATVRHNDGWRRSYVPTPAPKAA
jgi:SPP1 gp7 family putative phage head morphogenesis protein